jgi:hypothetical protein
MKRFLLFFVALYTLCFSAFSQATGYDAIATAYVTTTISQQVVFNSTMKSGGSFTFSVLAHNGGGRAGESDTANVKIQFYTSSGSLVASVNSNNSGNLPNPNAVCGNPCIDTSVPWTTVTTSATLTAAQAATVAYATVSMYGIDGSYWAGDYGPWYRAPTLQLNGGGNLLYNPEFGPYNGVTAQGWVSNPGFGVCQGAWGGSNACIVNSDGVPGTSTTGLVANQNGGGPSATGGTTSGQAGGYNDTMTVTNAGTGATAGSPPAPTVVSTQNTTIITTVTNGATVNTYSQPVTITTWSDGSTTTANNGNGTLISSTITGSGGGITQQQQNDVNAFNANPISGNGIYIQQSGSHDVVTISQIGTQNLIGGVNQQFAKIQDGNNYISIKQGNGNLGKNEIDLSVTGGTNSLYLVQASDPLGVSAGNNYQKVNVAGFSNTVNTVQTNDGGIQGQFAEINVTGNYNNVSVTQNNNTQKQAFVSANGNNNTITTTQTGTGAHYLNVTETGNGNSATVNQSGSTANSATISLTNAGAPASVNLTQTGGQSYSVQQTCYTTCGTLTVRQGN